jgi:branched-chain amino acid transport system permease protein
MDYPLHLLIFFEVYLLAALGLNLLVGYSGFLSLAHAGYFAVGSYAYAIAALRFGSWACLAMLVAVLVAAAVSGLLWVLSLRLTDDAWVLGSLAVQCMVFAVLNNWSDGVSAVGSIRNLTNGPHGISGFGLHLLGKPAAPTESTMAIVCTISTLFLAALYWLMLESPWSRALRAMRDDELAMRALAKSVPLLRFQVFVLGCALAGAGGALYAAYVGYVHPEIASLDQSILMLCMVVVGGTGTVFRGPIVGTLLLLLIPELLRLGNIPQNTAGAIRLLLYGIALVVLMHMRPRGIAGKYELE